MYRFIFPDLSLSAFTISVQRFCVRSGLEATAYYLMICCGINIVLDLVLVLGCRMGVLGVAVGTLISQGISAVLVTRALMYHTEELKLDLRKLHLEKDLLLNMLKIGLPTRYPVKYV